VTDFIFPGRAPRLVALSVLAGVVAPAALAAISRSSSWIVSRGGHHT
jgi:hypothetical protein